MFFQILVPKTRERWGNPVEQVLRTGQATGAASQAILISRNGTERLIENRGAPIRDSFGDVIGVVVVFRDITEKQKVEAELLKASKLESVGLLAGGIAHDFNNILTAIIGNLSLARRFAQPPDPIYQRLEEVERLRCEPELDAAIAYFCQGRGAVRQTASVGQIIRESAEFALRGSNVRCEFDWPVGVAPVDVDTGQMSQVIHNLVINSMQAMPEGGVIRVWDRMSGCTRRPGCRCRKGITCALTSRTTAWASKASTCPESLIRSSPRKKRGSGLGLATAYAILKRHDAPDGGIDLGLGQRLSCLSAGF